MHRVAGNVPAPCIQFPTFGCQNSCASRRMQPLVRFRQATSALCRWGLCMDPPLPLLPRCSKLDFLPRGSGGSRDMRVSDIAISQALAGVNGWFDLEYGSSVRVYGSSGWLYGSSVCAAGASGEAYGSSTRLYRSDGRSDGAGVRLSGPFGVVGGSAVARGAGSAAVAPADASCINDGAGLRCPSRPRVDGVVHTFTYALQKFARDVTGRNAHPPAGQGKETAHGCGVHSSRGQGFY